MKIKERIITLIFIIIGLVAEAALAIATVEFWASETFMANMFFLRKVVYIFLIIGHIWVIKEFIYIPINHLVKRR